ncbi:MAG: NTP transferase domain-containing protein [Candidatus Paceibacterota bacterium]|jgi:CTP:phosphocholine cytidylyltransferase-like protein
MKTVVILAAGMGTRFNSKEPKCLSAVDNQSVISRAIGQVNRYIPDAKIKVVVGYNREQIENHTAGYGISYVVNDKFASDKNIWSAVLGAKGAKDGVLILEGDCVYDDLAFREIGASLSKDSVMFLGGQADQNKSNGIVRVKNNLFEDFIIGKRNGPIDDQYFDMTGALWISSDDVSTFVAEASSLAKGGLDFYYFEPLFDKEKFHLTCKIVSGKRYTFNTQSEYESMLKNIGATIYFDTSKLKHIESFSKKRVAWLKKKILDEKIWTRPICVDPNGLVMDGQHRMEVSKELGLKKVPVIVFDYSDVEFFSLRKNYEVSVESIRNRVDQDDIYPYKTVKHKFPVEITDCNISLDSLLYP